MQTRARTTGAHVASLAQIVKYVPGESGADSVNVVAAVFTGWPSDQTICASEGSDATLTTRRERGTSSAGTDRRGT